MQSQCVMESEVNFTNLMTLRLSDINIHHRRVDGINQNLYFTISIKTQYLIVRFSILVNTRNIYMMLGIPQAVSYTHLTLPTIYSV